MSFNSWRLRVVLYDVSMSGLTQLRLIEWFVALIANEGPRIECESVNVSKLLECFTNESSECFAKCHI